MSNLETLKASLAKLYGGQPADHHEQALHLQQDFEVHWRKNAVAFNRFEGQFRTAAHPWETAPRKPRADFIDWLADRQRKGDPEGRNPLPPKAMAKRMIQNSVERGDDLAANLWEEFEESRRRRTKPAPVAAPELLPSDYQAAAPVDEEQAREARRRIAELLKAKGLK